tara:strand:- start:187 stop:1173 length:987 start_codon:yes stop_codon:yes gene_type:complete
MRVRSTIVLIILLAVQSQGFVNAEDTFEDEPSNCDKRGLIEIILGNGAVYCDVTDSMNCDEMGNNCGAGLTRYVDMTYGDDQHISFGYKEAGFEEGEDVENWMTPPPETWNALRWENVNDVVIYGQIHDGQYHCDQYMIPESYLPENWSLIDLNVDVQFPEWCSQPATDDDKNYTNGTHPFVDVWMIDLRDVTWNREIRAERVNSNHSSSTFEDLTKVETRVWYHEDHPTLNGDLTPGSVSLGIKIALGMICGLFLAFAGYIGVGLVASGLEEKQKKSLEMANVLNDLAGMTVEELKNRLREAGLSASGDKLALIQRLEFHIKMGSDV